LVVIEFPFPIMGAAMTKESINILLTLMLLGGIRTAIFVSDWLTALVRPAMPERPMQHVALKRDRPNR
jgi:hypothetical protein